MSNTKIFVFACAVGLAVAASPSLGAWPWESDTRVEVREVKAVPGRYQIVGTRGQTYLLDTIEGRVWGLTQFTDLKDEPTVWDDMDVLRPSDEKFTSIFDLVRVHPTKKKQAPDQKPPTGR